jgi:hypothetical protein
LTVTVASTPPRRQVAADNLTIVGDGDTIGRFEAAAQRLTEAEAAFQKAKDPAITIAYTWLLLAMTHERLSHREQAREWLAKAVREIDDPPAERAKDPGRGNWNRQLTLRLLRGEAEALIGGADNQTRHKETKDTEKKP